MMITGRVEKEEGIWWSAHCDIAGVFTQGKSKLDAMKQLAAAFEDVVDTKGFKVTVTDRGDGTVLVEANEPGSLLAIVLRYQREVNKLSLSDVAEKIGASSRNAYARYEQGAAMPKLDTVYQLLAAVAPNVCLAFVERVAAIEKPISKATDNEFKVTNASFGTARNYTDAMADYVKARERPMAADSAAPYVPSSTRKSKGESRAIGRTNRK